MKLTGDISKKTEKTAIESEKIQKEYLQKIERVKEDICITDDDFPNSLDDFFEPIYVKTLKK